nr:MAG TPA: hypothetical protein [Caudoviricetes sp.]
MPKAILNSPFLILYFYNILRLNRKKVKKTIKKC